MMTKHTSLTGKLRQLLDALAGKHSAGRPARRSPFRPCLEALEDRLTPTNTWIGPAGGTWSTPSYWSNGVAPTTGQDIQFGSGNGTSGANTASTDNIPNLQLHSITIQSDYTSIITVSQNLSTSADVVQYAGTITDTQDNNHNSLTISGSYDQFGGSMFLASPMASPFNFTVGTAYLYGLLDITHVTITTGNGGGGGNVVIEKVPPGLLNVHGQGNTIIGTVTNAGTLSLLGGANLTIDGLYLDQLGAFTYVGTIAAPTATMIVVGSGTPVLGNSTWFFIGGTLSVHPPGGGAPVKAPGGGSAPSSVDAVSNPGKHQGHRHHHKFAPPAMTADPMPALNNGSATIASNSPTSSVQFTGPIFVELAQVSTIDANVALQSTTLTFTSKDFGHDVPASMRITGNFTADAGSTVSMRVGLQPNYSLFDNLSSNGSVQIAGLLAITTPDPSPFSPGTTFTPITYGIPSGPWANVSLPPHNTWTQKYTNTSYSITAKS